MRERGGSRLRRIGMAGAIKLVLVAQVLLALVVLAVDLPISAMPRFGPGLELPSGPVAPGDQVRRFEPRRDAPQAPVPLGPQAVPLPDGMPERLTAERRILNGRDVLLLSGAIEEGDAERIVTTLDADGAPDLIALNSPGGIVQEALALGREVRARGLDTAVLSGAICMSACPFLFASGVEREASRGAAIGLHQIYYETPALLPVVFAVEDIQRGNADLMTHLIDMGVETEVMVHALSTPPEGIYVLVEEQLTGSRLATRMTE